MSKTVIVTSVFNADMDRFFSLIQKLETLQYIAKPYAPFENVDKETDIIWEAGKTFSFKFKMFSLISLGIHTIKVREFNVNAIYTNEGNGFCPVWDHRIFLKKIDEAHISYTDEVEIDAGWKTPFIYIWAKAFYRHRQKKWKKLLLCFSSEAYPVKIIKNILAENIVNSFHRAFNVKPTERLCIFYAFNNFVYLSLRYFKKHPVVTAAPDQFSSRLIKLVRKPHKLRHFITAYVRRGTAEVRKAETVRIEKGI